MKRIVTIGIFLLITNSLFSQKLDYDKDSKWFLGLNVGAAWNTTDVKNKTSIGAGLTFGRSFNYNYGKIFSFDLRARYLGGLWRGQDYDTTSLTNYNSSISPSGNVVNIYDTLGYTINNFETQAHELGLELVLHLNILKERTGWDPYIFGGVNLVWNKTKGDLFFEDTLFFDDYVYDYSPDGISKPDWKDLSDGVYDLVLDGSEEDRYNVDFMPSLGFGLSYQVGPRFAIGVEHKTTFAMKDLFDGYIDDTPKWGNINNDIYHYTSAFLKFNFRKYDKFEGDPNTPDPGTNSVLGTANECDDPTIKMTQPTAENSTVYSAQYTVKALIAELAGRENIVFKVNGSVSTNFLFNRNNERFESTIFLKPGDNIISIKAGNGCGSADEIIHVNYVDCVAPQIVMTSPQSSGMTVDEMSMLVTANISNSSSVQFFVNGNGVSNFNINQSTGSFSSNVQLIDGTNSLKIIAQNQCGTVENEFTVQFKDCIDPFISISNGSGSQIVEQQQFVFSATIIEVNSSNNISFRLNGMNHQFSFNPNTHLFQANVSLVDGTNTFEIFASNECGTATSTITIEYSACKNPFITILSPNVSSTENTVVQFSAKLENISNRGQLKFYVNNVLLSIGTYNGTTKLFNANVTLVVGNNTLRLVAQNDCGSVSKTVTIVRNTIAIDPVIVEKITICHFPPGNTDNPQQIEIPLSAWPAHQAHGDNLGPCLIVEDPVSSPPSGARKILICHKDKITGSFTEMYILPKDWNKHKSHGDKKGPCSDKGTPEGGIRRPKPDKPTKPRGRN